MLIFPMESSEVWYLHSRIAVSSTHFHQKMFIFYSSLSLQETIALILYWMSRICAFTVAVALFFFWWKEKGIFDDYVAVFFVERYAEGISNITSRCKWWLHLLNQLQVSVLLPPTFLWLSRQYQRILGS